MMFIFNVDSWSLTLQDSQYFDGLTWVGPEKAGNPHHLHGYVTKKIARRSLLDWLANHNTKLLEQ